jgi:hypothetical protein
MQVGSFDNWDGEIEVDETYIGGKARNMHKHLRKQKITGTGGKDKAIVLGLKQRGGRVRAAVIVDTSKASLYPHVHPVRTVARE